MDNNSIKQIVLSVECGTHKKGEPYPEYDFSLLEKYRVSNKNGVVAVSNEDLKNQIDRQHETKDEVKYFYYVVKSENV